MRMASRDDVALYYTHAIEMLLRRAQDEKPLGTLEFFLLSKVGVLTDCAFWAAMVPVGHVAVDCARIEEKNRQGEIVSLILVALETGRYAMSMAQHLLFRIGYGFDMFLPAALWHADVVIAEYVSVLLSGLNGQRLRELLVRLGMPEACCGNAAVLEQTMSFGTVFTIHSRQQIVPTEKSRDAQHAVRKLFAGLLQCESSTDGTRLTNAEARKRADGTAAVIVNAPGAPHAGVIVVIPRVAVILIQCKMCGDDTEVVDVEADAENLSGELTELNELTGVPPGANFRGLATNKTRMPSDLHRFFPVYHGHKERPSSDA